MKIVKMKSVIHYQGEIVCNFCIAGVTDLTF